MPWIPIGLAVVAAGGAAFLFFSRTANASVLPQTDSAALPPGVVATTPSTSSSLPGIPASTASLLVAGDPSGQTLALQAFGIQALLYSFGTSDVVPDALASTVNTQLSQLSQLAGADVISPSFNTGSYAQVRQWLYAQDPNRQLRPLPFTMPVALINAVNAATASVDSGAVALDALAPAGSAIMPAGACCGGGLPLSPFPDIANAARIGALAKAGQVAPAG